MGKIVNNFLRESYYHGFLDNGLEYFIYPKKKIKNYYCSVHVKFGSVNEYYTENGIKKHVVPGAAHFLEHMSFSLSDGTQVSDYFEQYGADVNAYTAHLETAYYFNTTAHFDECVSLLFKTVFQPEFLEIDVENERSIILSEYKDGLDNFDSNCNYELLQSLFVNNSIRNRVIGSEEDIRNVKFEELKHYHDVFYQPSNMFVVLSGDFDPIDVENKLNNNISLFNFSPIKFEYNYLDEPKKVNRKNYEFIGKTFNRQVLIGFKFNFNQFKPEQIEITAKIFEYIFDYFFSSSSSYYQKMYYQNVFNDSFFYSFNITNRFGYCSFGCAIDECDLFVKGITDILFNLKMDDFTIKSFEHFKKYEIGLIIKDLSSQYEFISSLESEIIDNRGGFDKFDIMNDFKFEDIKEVFDFFSQDNMTIVIGNPENVD